ncbi:MAG: tRNA preQ1(34) S-adenosylmethionine ribosyltransferase-isomerase QueA [Defluviitaleaceae bacterium]|nr:tRNA preQ1(34) S-adenosylmethionine ribosyltransferase-isomerase QueA [Defluviitaleaceae bacterium]
MHTNDFWFELPDELIAQTPLEDRSASRLLMLGKDGGIRHGGFRDIVDILNPGDCIVLNETKVIPARLRGVRQNGGQVELLLLRRLDDVRWETLARPGRKVKPGDKLVFGELSAEAEGITEDCNRIIRFEYNGIFEEILDRLGETPLPPYIRENLADSSRYQTVYAKHEGSAAAPTAGLHFTEEVLAALAAKGVSVAKITLHVGLGTFRPVKVENIEDHKMHSEFYNIEPSQAQIINSAKNSGGRIIAVGTTVCRTLETCAEAGGSIRARTGWTDIFIYPGYDFKIIDGLITNFHLPGSTLIMLVSTLAGRENVLRAYREAVEERYRFYSFGDAMLIV